jgi:predicted phosphodiesterase
MIAIISDIHGNYEALKAVLQHIDKTNINEIYCLGDIVGYYPQVNECCDELIRRNIKCILGNHDWYMISDTKCIRSKSANDCIEIQKKIITDNNLSWLRSLPIYIKTECLSLVHAGWSNPIDEYLFEIKSGYFDDIDGNYFCSGHTHIPQILKFGEKIYCNPGSVGQPRDFDPRASFAIFDGKKFEIIRVNYNIDAICQVSKDYGYDEYYYNRLTKGLRNFKE